MASTHFDGPRRRISATGARDAIKRESRGEGVRFTFAECWLLPCASPNAIQNCGHRSGANSKLVIPAAAGLRGPRGGEVREYCRRCAFVHDSSFEDYGYLSLGCA